MKDIQKAVPRVDARGKAEGTTAYLADLRMEGMLHGKFFRSTRARARIVSIRKPELPAGYYIIDKDDVPGENVVAMIENDWPAFVDREVNYLGEIISLVVGPDREEIVRIHDSIEVEYEELEPAFSLEEASALKGGPIHGKDNLFADYFISKGTPDEAFRKAARIIEDTCDTGLQEHIYIEPQGMLGWWEDDRVVLKGSLQCPYYVKHAAQEVLGCDDEGIRVIQSTTGGAFGGKEDYPEVIGAALAVAVNRIKKPVRIVFDRTEDISFTCKRHPSRIRFRTAVDEKGGILGMDIDIHLSGGAYETYSDVVLQRTMFTATGVYDIPSSRVRGRAWATNMVPSGAFRGFGAPQALFGIETHMNHIARELKVDPLEYKSRYFLQKGAATVTNGRIYEDVLLPEMTRQIREMSNYKRKYDEYSKSFGRGIGVAFALHGCGFTGDGEQRLIKAVVRLVKREDEKIEILVSNVEMGQGLLTTYRKIVSKVLGVPLEMIIYENPDTARVPDSGPTAASRSIMVVGYLLQEAAKELKQRWDDESSFEVEKHFKMPPHTSWNQDTLQGDAYPSYGWGVVAVEVEVDPVTFEVETKGIWAVHDVGVPIDERVMEGQVTGGVIQALGYGSLEKLELKDGRFYQNTMTDYMIPTSLDFPKVEGSFVENPYPYGPFGAKGGGELVFDSAAPAFSAAVEQAIGKPISRIPVTPEDIMEVLS